MDLIVPAGGAAIIISTLLQIAKNTPWITFITRETGRLNAILSIIAAGLTTIGLSYAYTYDPVTGTFALTLTGTASTVLEGTFRWAGQWTLQHGFYKGFLVPAEIQGEMRAMLKEALFGQAPQLKADVPHVPTPRLATGRPTSDPAA